MRVPVMLLLLTLSSSCILSAAEYQDGKKLKNARITVRHNGVLIHEDQELPGGQTAGGKLKDGDSPGPVYLQNHGNPVRYRNIWVMEKK